MKKIKFLTLACVTAISFTTVASLCSCSATSRMRNGDPMMNSASVEINTASNAPHIPDTPDVPTPLPAPRPGKRPHPRRPHNPPRRKPMPQETPSSVNESDKPQEDLPQN